MKPRITDEEVAGLPVSHGRAELLEEIMTDARDTTPLEEAPRGRGKPWGWVAAGAAAAAVAALAVAPGLRGAAEPEGPATSPGFAASSSAPAERSLAPTPSGEACPGQPSEDGPGLATAPQDGRGSSDSSGPDVSIVDERAPEPVGPALGPVTAVAGGAYLVPGAGGWSLESLGDSADGYEIALARGACVSADITGYEAAAYQAYLDDRATGGGSSTGEVAGIPGTVTRYSTHDFEILLEPRGELFTGIRVTGLDRAAFVALLDEFVQADEAAITAATDVWVTPENRDARIAGLLEGVELPPGFTAEDVELDGLNDRYSASAAVAGQVGCAWLDEWNPQDPASTTKVAGVFEGSAEWPVLRSIEDQGGFSGVFVGLAQEIRAGVSDKGNTLTPEGLKPAIC